VCVALRGEVLRVHGSADGGPEVLCPFVCGAWRRLWRTVCEEREPWGRWSWV
jgi:hypothetical protein